uniref:ATPase AAA-type core domain-containing protein n=1 Tax=mine drainage metagenome TaxID=410659 RepID=E6PX25_9ZZZZ
MYPLPFEVQSGGTIAFFGMLGPILNELETGSILLIDELESSLHPNLARYILKMFNDPLLNPKGAQLIFTTHNPSLLDLDLLRRDQIWIAEKDGVGASEFKALSDFKPRKGQDVATAYLNGRFGGVPFVDEGLLRSALKINQDERTETVSTGEGV